MRDLHRFLTALVSCAALAACGDEDPKTEGPAGPEASPDVVRVSRPITADTRWTKDQTYLLDGHVFVEGGTLTIEAGTTILGQARSSLVVTQNGRLEASGTREAPIVFTSASPEGTRQPGDWGGLVLLGRAPINVSGGTEQVEGFATTDDQTAYGGSDPEHDCGRVEYVRIEFAGFELATDNELNGLTLAGCGARTVVDYVQVHLGADDGVEVFGGTVNLRHVVITQPDDDGLDWDYGWQGKAQFLFIQQNAIAGNYAIEADSNKNANDAEPRSNPEIWNASFVGSNSLPGSAGKAQFGAIFRRGTAARLSNVLFTHFTDGAIDVDGASSVAQANGGALRVENSIFFDNGDAPRFPAEVMDNDGGFDEAAFFGAEGRNNRFIDPMLGDMLNLVLPNPMPMAASPAMTLGATPPADGFFDPSATHVGAFGAENWMAGWTAFPAFPAF